MDRSGAYAARYVAKNLVAAGLAERCELQVSYAIGVAEPTSISINTFGTGKVDEDRLVDLVRDHFDLRPWGLIQMLDLCRPIYFPTAAYGHFGREEPDFTWERTDRAEALRASLSHHPCTGGNPHARLPPRRTLAAQSSVRGLPGSFRAVRGAQARPRTRQTGGSDPVRARGTG